MIPAIFLFALVLGGAGSALIKFGGSQINPIALVFFRALVSLIIVLPFVNRQEVTTAIKNSKTLIAAGLLFALNWIFFAYGIQRTNVFVGQLIYVPTSLIVAGLGYFLLREKLTKIQIIGLLLTLVGMLILFLGALGSQETFSLGTPLGNFLVMGGLISWSLYIIITRKVSDKFSPLSIIFVDFFLTTILSGILLIPASGQTDFLLLKFEPNLILSIIAAAVISSVGFFILSQWLIKNTSAFISSTFIYPTTLSALVYGIIFFGERLSLVIILASILILVGVFLGTNLSIN
ncbi:MAG: DMT family transporter [Patescibacteria group bacterium]